VVTLNCAWWGSGECGDGHNGTDRAIACQAACGVVTARGLAEILRRGELRRLGGGFSGPGLAEILRRGEPKRLGGGFSTRSPGTHPRGKVKCDVEAYWSGLDVLVEAEICGRWLLLIFLSP